MQSAVNHIIEIEKITFLRTIRFVRRSNHDLSNFGVSTAGFKPRPGLADI
jgi:hypothetical protein